MIDLVEIIIGTVSALAGPNCGGICLGVVYAYEISNSNIVNYFHPVLNGVELIGILGGYISQIISLWGRDLGLLLSNSSLAASLLGICFLIVLFFYLTVILIKTVVNFFISNKGNVFLRRNPVILQREMESFYFDLSLEGVNVSKDPLTYVLVQQYINNELTIQSNGQLRVRKAHYKSVFNIETPFATLNEYGKNLVFLRAQSAGPVALELARGKIDYGPLAPAIGVMGKKPIGSINPNDPIVVNKAFIILMYRQSVSHPSVQLVSDG